MCKNPFGAARRRPARLVRETMDDEFALFAAEIGQLEAAAKEKDAGDASPAEAPPPVPPPPPPPAPAPPTAPAPAPTSARPATIAKAPEAKPIEVGPVMRPAPGAPPPPSHPYLAPAASALGVPPQAPYPAMAPNPHLGGYTGGVPPQAAANLPPPPTGTAGAAMASVKKVGAPVYRSAGGDRWVDKSLADWPENDHRIFVGDLGPEATDELLARAFGRYPSFAMARVVMDKRTSKTKGYGFVSFLDPSDCAKAVKEMNGRYVGNRPVKLRRAEWTNRNDARDPKRHKAPPKFKRFDKRKHLPTGVDDGKGPEKVGGGKGGEGWGGGGSKGKYNLW